MRIEDPHLRRARNIALALFVLSLLAVLFAWFVFEWNIARPIGNEAARVLSKADPEDRDPPPLIRKAVLAGYRDALLALHVTRETNLQIFGKERTSHLHWMAHQVLEEVAWRRMSERELLAVFAADSWNGVDHGMNRLSLRLYAKPLHALTADQAAKLVALYQGPSYYMKHPEAWQARSDRLRAAMDRLPATR